MIGKMLEKMSFSDWLHLIGIAIILMTIGAWKQGVDDHIQNQDRHIISQDKTMESLATTLEKQNEKFSKVGDDLTKLKIDMARVQTLLKQAGEGN